MICDLFIRSYRKDFGWLELCLAAIDRYAREFRSVIVVIPESSRPWLKRIPMLAEGVRVETCADYRDDYLGQQATKLHADLYTDAELICHVDSDCIFVRPTTPQDLIVGGKAVIVSRPYADLGRHWPWQRPTEEFLGTEVSHDFMQRPPFVFPRWLYEEVREHAFSAHRLSLERYVTTRPPRGFSEFNVLGAWAKAHHPDSFVWIDIAEHGPVEQVCRWYWSWGGLDDGTREEIEGAIQQPEAML
jgi:uncharacterized protein DUF6492